MASYPITKNGITDDWSLEEIRYAADEAGVRWDTIRRRLKVGVRDADVLFCSGRLAARITTYRNPRSVGAMVRAWMVRRNVSAAQAAEALGCTTRHFLRMLAPRQPQGWRPANIEAIARLLNIPPDDRRALHVAAARQIGYKI